MLEVLRVNAGGYFQSVKTAEISSYLVINKIKKGNGRNFLSVSKDIVYELRQIFNSRFSE